MDERGKWQLVAWAVVAAVVVFLGARELGQRTGGGGGAAPVAVPGDARTAGATRRRAPPQPGAYVHVAGAVRRPGLYRVPAGSRVAAAVQRAGGPARGAQLAAVNLAARLQDGQQVVVPGGGAAAAGGSAAGAGAAVGTAPGAKVSLGSATAEQLEELDGIGPTLAEKIIEYRTKRGGFRSLDQLRQVDGIGEKRFEALKKGLTP